jgi:2-oxo-4-hydroxy-4-carboxy-5-ureidoimidazoline decarboxylase
MVESRPYSTIAALLDLADSCWVSLSPTDWREAFDHHPRIGQRTVTFEQHFRAVAWSNAEQSNAMRSDVADKEALAAAQREYEARFGHIFLVYASGRSSRELLDELQRRMQNEPQDELAVAAAEQSKITRQRLLRMLTGDHAT